MADLLFKKSNIGQVNIPDVKLSTGGIDNMRELAKQSGMVADSLRKQSTDLFSLEIETDARENLNNLFSSNSADPNNLSKEIQAYQTGLEKRIPLAMLPQVRQRFMSLAEPLISKSSANKSRLLDQQLMLATENNKNQLVMDINNNSTNLLNINPNISNEQRNVLATQSLNALGNTFETLQKTLSVKKSDGSFVYTPKQQIDIVKSAQNNMLQSTASNWLNQRPNKMEAFNDWINDKVNITTLDENGKPVDINIRKAFSPDVRIKVDASLRRMVLDDARLTTKALKEQQMLQKMHSEKVTKDLIIKSNNGTLNEEELYSRRGDISTSKFESLLKQATTIEGTTDNKIAQGIMDKIRAGGNIEQINAEIDTAVSERNLNFPDANKMKRYNEDRRVTKDPITRGLMHLHQKLSLNKVVNTDDALITAANSQRSYELEIENFISSEKREPTMTEAIGIAEELIPRFSKLKLNSRVTREAKPRGADQSWVINPQSVTIDNVKSALKSTQVYYRGIHNNNNVRASTDPRYLEEIRVLGMWEEVAQDNELREQEDKKSRGNVR